MEVTTCSGCNVALYSSYCSVPCRVLHAYGNTDYGKAECGRHLADEGQYTSLILVPPR